MLAVGHSSSCIRDLAACDIFLQTTALLAMLVALAASTTLRAAHLSWQCCEQANCIVVVVRL